ncbi:MAG TPA: MFS transporter [Candidatus Dormibacteraeota bacterium]|nr:MFS transporter [Candidatus Dormibacteraeota bacterium]
MVLITAGVTGIVTSVTMIGPLLVDIARDLNVSLGQAGLLAAAAGVPQALFSPFSGLLSDRLGRKPMIVMAFGSVAALSVAAALAPGFAALVVVRFLAGLLGSLAPTSLMASVGDLFPAERRARAMGWFNMGFSFAAIGGVPIMGAVGGALGWRWAFVAIGLLMLLLTGSIWLWFPRIPPDATGTSVLATYRAVWGVPRLLNLLGANLLERSLFAMVAIYLPAFVMLSFHMTAVGVAPVLVLVAIGAITGNVLGGRLGDRFHKPVIFVVAQVISAGLGLALFGAGLSLAPVVALAIALTLCNAASRPAFLAYGSELAPRQRGALFGLIALTNQSGLVIGAAVGAAAIGGGGYRGMALAALAQGAVAAGLALPLLRPRRAPSV